MKLMRNREVRFASIFCLAAALVMMFAVYLCSRDIKAVIVTAASCALIFAICTVFAYLHYKRISSIADDIDHILHGDKYTGFDEYTEGELGILQSEISKMTIRLREQESRVREEKNALADSLADISHQIRTPLTSINLLVSMLSEDGIAPERRQKLSHELYELLSRIDWLITALLKISKLDAGAITFVREKMALSDLINASVAPLLVPMDIKDQTLTLSADGDACIDPSWTREAIANIVKNCIEHTPNGGRISVTAQSNALFSEIVITDSGSGISKSDLPHIFERFYKGENSDEKSFGIGLALSRMIITSQGGSVKAENCQSGGARFTVRFYNGTI